MGAGELPFSETPTPVGPGSASQSSHDQVSAKPTAASRDWLAYFQSEISISHADIPIILCCLVSGLCDSSAYNAWTCFVSMQTGNTIFLALGASGQPNTHPYGWLKSLLSIVFFLFGCFCTAQTRHFYAKSRGTLAVSFFIQGACIVVAAALVQAKVVPSPVGLESEEGQIHFIELIPLAFLAFQSGGQIVTSRILAFNEVPTTVLTSVYCDLVSDPKILERSNVKRNRRVGAVLMILIGGIIGGWLSRSPAGMSTTLWLAAAIKLGIAVSWSFWKPKSVIEN